jgi:hypothetical protein
MRSLTASAGTFLILLVHLVISNKCARDAYKHNIVTVRGAYFRSKKHTWQGYNFKITLIHTTTTLHKLNYFIWVGNAIHSYLLIMVARTDTFFYI